MPLFACALNGQVYPLFGDDAETGQPQLPRYMVHILPVLPILFGYFLKVIGFNVVNQH